MRSRVRDVVRGRIPQPSDDSGNIAMLMLVIIVSATIGALLLAMVINQTTTTRFDASRVRSLDAAQSGIDVMLGQLRNATTTGSDNKTYGTADALPCVPQATPMTGTANASGSMTYSVWVTYYRNDPSKGTQPAMSCVSGYGPFDSTSGSHTPRYAVITSFGLDTANPNSASKGRTLTTTYIFQTDDVNIPGGQIQLFPNSSGAKWCMDAGSSTPAVGTTVVLRACSTAQPAPPQQVWAYRSDLSIQLVSSITTATPSGLCLDTSPTAHATGDVIVLNTCNAVGSAAYNQQWSVDDYAHLQGAKNDKSDIDGFCITAGSQTSLQALTLGSCSSNVSDTAQTWVPASSTGAGMAGAGNKQIVNYQNFATCIDVTNKNVNYGYLVLFTCKQDPDPTKVTWNQKFSPALGPASSTAGPQVGPLITTVNDASQGNNGVSYCLQAPATPGGYVTVVLSAACTTTWTWNQTRDNTGAALPYANVYTVTTVIGGTPYCLAPGPKTDLHNGQYLKIVIAACTGGTEQKWNADPSVLASRLTNTGEK